MPPRRGAAAGGSSRPKRQATAPKESATAEPNTTGKRKAPSATAAAASSSAAPGTTAAAASSGKGGLDCAFEAAKLAAGFSAVVGVDEAGRGPLAGPVVAAAVAVPPSMARGVGAEHSIAGVDDSKGIPEPERERLYGVITGTPGLAWAVAVLDHEVIDELNILEATMTAMRQCVADVRAQLASQEVEDDEAAVPPPTGKRKKGAKKMAASASSSSAVFVAVDGNRVPAGIDADASVTAEALVKGDGRVFSIAAASILAKVTRDRIMLEYDAEFPEYGFKDHKGYGVAKHVAAIHRCGASRIHRKSFQPVKGILGWERPVPACEEEDKGDKAAKKKKGGRSGGGSATTEPKKKAAAATNKSTKASAASTKSATTTRDDKKVSSSSSSTTTTKKANQKKPSKMPVVKQVAAYSLRRRT